MAIHVLPLALTPTTAARLGITRAAVRHQIARGRWTRVLPGVVVTDPGVDERSMLVAAGLALAGPSAAVTGWDALPLLGLRVQIPAGAPVAILTTEGHNRSVSGIRIRPTQRPFRTSHVSGDHPTFPFAPIVHPARAVCDALLGVRFLPSALAVVSYAVQQQVCSDRELREELDAGPRNGSAMVRRALVDIGRAESVAEVNAARALVRGHVCDFDQNVWIHDASSRAVIARVDLLWRELRACLEIDSWKFHFSAPSWADTLAKHTKLTRRGLAVLHYAPSDIHQDPARFGAEVRTWLTQRAAELGCSVPPRARWPRPTTPAQPFFV